MAFKKIVQTSGRGFRPHATILSKGGIGFNRGAINVCKITTDSYVIIFYDEKENKMGFRFTTDSNEEGSTHIRTYTTGAVISAKAILEQCRIDYSVTMSYDLQYDTVNEFYVIDLLKGTQKRKPKKEKKK
jgi:hypothetical protein